MSSVNVILYTCEVWTYYVVCIMTVKLFWALKIFFYYGTILLLSENNFLVNKIVAEIMQLSINSNII